MSDDRASFPSTVDANGVGKDLRSVQEGDPGAAKNGSIALGFVDNSNNLVLPKLNPEGALPVTLDAGTTKRAGATILSGALSGVDTRDLLAEITVSLEKVYTCFSFMGSSTREFLYELVHVDDEGVTDTETEIASGYGTPGQLTIDPKLLKDIFSTVGLTGVQKFKMYITPLQKVADVRGHFSCNEAA